MGSQRGSLPSERRNLSSVAWIFPGPSYQRDIPGTPPQGSIQDSPWPESPQLAVDEQVPEGTSLFHGTETGQPQTLYLPSSSPQNTRRPVELTEFSSSGLWNRPTQGGWGVRPLCSRNTPSGPCSLKGGPPPWSPSLEALCLSCDAVSRDSPTTSRDLRNSRQIHPNAPPRGHTHTL